MEKDGSLRIAKWTEGIGQSPHVGFGQMVNVDIFSQPGSVKISNKLKPDANASSVVDNLPKWGVQDPRTGDFYSVDRNGKLYKRDNGIATWSVITGHGTAAKNGEGIAIWNDYLFYARRTKVDVYGPLSGSPSWTNNWQTLESSFGYDLHPMLSAQDGHLYIGNAQYVDTVIQTLGDLIVNPSSLPFDPGNPVTYTYNDPQLTLQTAYRVTCLEELGTNLVVGTLVGNNGVINIGDMFFWDGASDSFVRGATIHFAENGVWLVKNSGNVLHTIAGLGLPRMFQSVTSQAQEVKRFNNIDLPFNTELRLFPGATELKEGEVLFGIGHAVGINGPNPLGVYAFRNGAYVLRYLPSVMEDGSNDTLLIGMVKSNSSREILVSWYDGTNYGIDILTENLYTEYTAYVESPLYTVGSENDPKTFEQIEVRMGRKLKSGDGVRIKARKALDESWTTIATFDFTTYGARYAMRTKVANISELVDCQIRIELTTANNATVSPELREVILK